MREVTLSSSNTTPLFYRKFDLNFDLKCEAYLIGYVLEQIWLLKEEHHN